MARVLVLGAGRMGYACALDLSRSGIEVVLGDAEDRRARETAERLGCSWMTVDVSKDGWTRELPGGLDLVCTALPLPLGYSSIKALVEGGFNVVDISLGGGEDLVPIARTAEKRKCYFVPYAGLAPGLSHFLSGRAYFELGGLDSLSIYVGGLPLDPEGKPLATNLTFSSIAFLEQYVEKSVARKAGKTVRVDPLAETDFLEVPEVGELEYFASGALHSLLDTFPEAQDMAEYTLRWPGHIDQMRLLRNLGLLSKEKVKLDGVEVAPIHVLGSVFEESLARDPRDLVVLMVEAARMEKRIRYLLVQRYDEEQALTAMAITTGFTQSVMAQMVLGGHLPAEDGKVLPEEVGKDPGSFEAASRMLRGRGIHIQRL